MCSRAGSAYEGGNELGMQNTPPLLCQGREFVVSDAPNPKSGGIGDAETTASPAPSAPLPLILAIDPAHFIKS